MKPVNWLPVSVLLERCCRFSGRFLKPLSFQSILHAGPLFGLAALLFAFLQIFASFAVLWASHNRPTSTWKYQPNVYLAILTAISNKALAFACIKGTIVTWWLKATSGATLSRLQNDYNIGLFTYKALAAGRHFNALAIACICVSLAIIDGPLLQRASSVRSVVPFTPRELSVEITPEMPQYSSGGAQFGELNGTSTDTGVMGFDHWFAPVIDEFLHNLPITGGISGCPHADACSAVIRAPALAFERCESTLTYRNFTAPLSAVDAELYSEFGGVDIPDRGVFGVDLKIRSGTKEQVIVQTTLTDDSVTRTCAGHVNVTDCCSYVYVSAIGEYAVEVSGGAITFSTGTGSPNIVALANNTALTPQSIIHYGLKYPGEDFIVTTLSGVAVGASFRYNTLVSVVPGLNGSVTVSGSTNYFAFQHMSNFAEQESGSQCAPSWTDPLPDVIAGLNEFLMFRAGISWPMIWSVENITRRIDPGLMIQYDATGQQTNAINVFQSDFSYFIAAAVVEMVCISAILYTFYGWWRLCRETSLSPLEMAKAFDAPLLQNEKGNLTASDLAKDCGSRLVRYGKSDGEIVHGDAQTGFFREEKLVFREEGTVRPVDSKSKA